MSAGWGRNLRGVREGGGRMLADGYMDTYIVWFV